MHFKYFLEYIIYSIILEQVLVKLKLKAIQIKNINIRIVLFIKLVTQIKIYIY